MLQKIIFTLAGSLIFSIAPPNGSHSQTITFEKQIGRSLEDWANSVQQTQDGGYIITGVTNLPFWGLRDDVFLIKTDAYGDTLWTRTISRPFWDAGLSVQQTQDGGYIVSGYTDAGGGGMNTYLIKANANGDTVWTRIYRLSFYNRGNAVLQADDGGYLVIGTAWDKGLLLRTTATGDTVWTRAFSGSASGFTHFEYGKQTTDGGFSFLANRGPRIYLFRTNAFGDTLWTKAHGPGGDVTIDCSFAEQTIDGGFIITGSIVLSLFSAPDVYLLKVNGDGVVAVDKTPNLELLTHFHLSQNYPNPFNPNTTIRFALRHPSFVTLKVYNILGKEVADLVAENLQAGRYEADWNASGLASGVYLYRLQAGEFVETKKLTLLK